MVHKQFHILIDNKSVLFSQLHLKTKLEKTVLSHHKIKLQYTCIFYQFILVENTKIIEYNNIDYESAVHTNSVSLLQIIIFNNLLSTYYLYFEELKHCHHYCILIYRYIYTYMLYIIYKSVYRYMQILLWIYVRELFE